MKKSIKFKALVGGAIAIILIFLITLGVMAHKKTAQREIAYAQEQIDADADLWDLKRELTTKKARDYAEAASKEHEEMIDNYPMPTIELLNPHEAQSRTAGGITFTETILYAGGSDPTYSVQFKVQDGEEAFVDWLDLSRDGRDPIRLSLEDGVYSYELPLDEEENSFELIVKNKYKEDSLSITVIRDENQQEKSERLDGEASEREWLQSKAGQICSRHPEWSHNDCEKLADHKYWVGMSYDMLVESFGQPSSKNPSNYGYGTQWQWCWTSWTPSCFYDENGDGIIDVYN